MITTRDFLSLLKPYFFLAGLSVVSCHAVSAQDADTDTSSSNAIDASASLSTGSTADASSDTAALQQATSPELGGLPVEEALYSPDQLQALVGPYALYPDDLLAIVLPAATYPLEIVLAARFLERFEADESLEPEESWDDSIVALLNYPEVIEMMNDNIDETWQLGEAVIGQQSDVLQAIEDFRQLAYDAGNLQSDERQTVEVVQEDEQEAIVITQVEKEVVYVPRYIVEEVIVEQHVPVYHYHSIPRPVYYYPYPVGHRFHSGFFWGVTTAFSIGWSDYFLHVYHPSYRYHPYYGRRYYYNDYHYRRPSINIFNNYYVDNSFRRIRDRHRYGSYWRPQRHFGSRPYDYRYNNYYVGGGDAGGRGYNRGRGGQRTVADFADDRRRSQLNGQQISNSIRVSGFGAETNRRLGDRRGGGRLNGQQLTSPDTDANALSAARGAQAGRSAQSTSPIPRGSRRENGRNAESFNALRNGGSQTTRQQATDRSALSRENSRQNARTNTRQSVQRNSRENVQENRGATFDAFRNRSRNRSVTSRSNSGRVAPREDSSSLVAPSNRTTTTTQTRRPTRGTNRPRISSDRERRSVTTNSRSRPTQIQRQPQRQAQTSRSSNNVSRFNNQRSQRSASGQGSRRSAVQSRSPSRSRSQLSTPSRQPSARSNNRGSSSSFNSSRRGSSSMQRPQRSRLQASRPQARSQPAPRSNRSAASFSSLRSPAVGGGGGRVRANRRNP